MIVSRALLRKITDLTTYYLGEILKQVRVKRTHTVKRPAPQDIDTRTPSGRSTLPY